MPAAYGSVHPEFHVSYLQPHLGPPPLLPPAPLLLDDVATGEYDVGDILDLHMGHFGPKYLLK